MNGILDFLMSNWDSILVVLIAAAVLLWLMLRGKRQYIDQIVYYIVTELEREYGAGTGNLKLAAAINELYPRLPAIIRLFATEERMKQWIEDGLTLAKQRWENNSSIKNYIESE